MITFRRIKSGPVAFLGFLSLKSYLTIETTRKALIGESKGGPARKAHRHAGAY